jgi:hypothetical protein
MTDNRQSSAEPASSQFHPIIYGIIIGLCLWLILSVWGFSAPGYTGLVLTVVSLFIFVAVAIPMLLWRISRWRRDGRPDPAARSRIGDWLAHDFEAWQGRQRGLDAAIEVLLPIAAVAFGMSAFALVLHLSVST